MCIIPSTLSTLPVPRRATGRPAIEEVPRKKELKER